MPSLLADAGVLHSKCHITRRKGTVCMPGEQLMMNEQTAKETQKDNLSFEI